MPEAALPLMASAGTTNRIAVPTRQQPTSSDTVPHAFALRAGCSGRGSLRGVAQPACNRGLPRAEVVQHPQHGAALVA